MITMLPFMLKFKTQVDERGNLTVIDGWKDIPLDVKRAFWIWNVPPGARRGGHAHKLCKQIIVAMAGSVQVMAGGQVFTLDEPGRGLYIPPGVSVTLDNFAPGTALLVLCSHLFAEEDYIKDVTA